MIIDSTFAHTVILALLAGGFYTLGHVLGIPDLGVLAGILVGWAAPSPKSMLAAREARRRASSAPPGAP